jgi:hypothetical protein
VPQKISTATEENATNVGNIERREFKLLRIERLEQRQNNVCGTRNKTILSVKKTRNDKETAEIKEITLRYFQPEEKKDNF